MVTISVAIFAALPVFGDTPQSSESWLGVYIMNQKLGYMHITTDRTTFEGRECSRIQSFMRTKMVVLGANVQQDLKTTTYMGDHYAPVFEVIDQSSGGQRNVTEARFGEKEVKCKLTTGNGESSKTIPIPEGANLIGDSMYVLGEGKPEIGKKAVMHIFNPLGLSIDPITVEVLRQEQLTIKNKPYDTYVVKCSMGKLGDATTWQLANGDIIKSVLAMGLTLQIETAEEAVAGVDSGYTPAADFALLTSVTSNIDIPNARSLRILDVKLTGNLDKKMGICDSRQKVKWLDPVGDAQVGDFRIDAKNFDAANSVNLPVQDASVAEYLQPTAFLQCDAPEIKSTATKIVGQETSAYKAASKIRKWVNDNMKPQADMGIPRPAVDVLKIKVGVCRDYAVLYGALARAAGIPTKIVAGIVYMDGRFYYHAWAESYVGEWVPFDATLESDFVDATHIKLTEGDATSMFDMTGVFGTMKAEIVGYK